MTMGETRTQEPPPLFPPAPIPPNDVDRVAVLKSYNVMDSPAELAFDRITSLGARLFHMPVVMVNIIGEDRLFAKSSGGTMFQAGTCNPRHVAMCAWTVAQEKEDCFVVRDCRQDPRFINNPLVAQCGLNFYAGAPLVVEGGHKLGTLCLMDTEPHPEWSITSMLQHRDLADMVVSELRLRRTLNDQHLNYITSTAHNLRTPLQCFSLVVGAMKGVDNMPQEANELLDQAESHVDIMQWTVAKSMDVARKRHFTEAEASGKDLGKEFEATTLQDVLLQVQKVIDPLPKTVPVEYRVEPGCPNELFTDKCLLWRSIIELLANACRLTMSGKVEVVFSAGGNQASQPDGQPAPPTLRVEVRDSGPGVPEEIRGLLFSKPFIHSSDQTDGLGMGCYYLAHNMELLKGSQGFCPNTSSQTGTGSVFWLEAPVLQPPQPPPPMPAEGVADSAPASPQPDPQAPPPPPADPLTPSPGARGARCDSDEPVERESRAATDPGLVLAGTAGGRRRSSLQAAAVAAAAAEATAAGGPVPMALVIDDCATIRVMMRRMLSKQGFEVDVAENGREGLDKLKAKEYDAAFVDFLMPLLTGPECVAKYREWVREQGVLGRRDCIIIGMSANAVDHDVKAGIQAGMSKYHDKPVTGKKLGELVAEIRVAAALNAARAALPPPVDLVATPEEPPRVAAGGPPPQPTSAQEQQQPSSPATGSATAQPPVADSVPDRGDMADYVVPKSALLLGQRTNGRTTALIDSVRSTLKEQGFATVDTDSVDIFRMMASTSPFNVSIWEVCDESDVAAIKEYCLKEAKLGRTPSKQALVASLNTPLVDLALETELQELARQGLIDACFSTADDPALIAYLERFMIPVS